MEDKERGWKKINQGSVLCKRRKEEKGRKTVTNGVEFGSYILIFHGI